MIRIDALKLREAPINLIIDEPAQSLELLDDPDYEFIGFLRGEALFTRVREETLARGELSVGVRTHCVRCLEPVEFTLRARVEVVYMNDPMLLDPHYDVDRMDDVVYYDGIVIEPMADFRDLLLLELPPYPTCELQPGKACPLAALQHGPLTFGPAESEEEAEAPPTRTAAPAPEAPASGGAPADWKAALRRLAQPRNEK